MKLGMGVPAAPLRPFVDSGVAFLDRLQEPVGAQARQGSASVPYLAYLATSDPRYLATLRRWAGDTAYGELQALAALEAGDTAAAAAAARLFPDADSTRRAGAALNPTRWVARAEVLEGLGELRRALAVYEALDPTSIHGNAGDAGWALYARSFLARGRLHERLGERDRAIAAYERFLALWKEADPVLEPQLREARAGLARLRDAGAATEVR
jgi:tetratricopeptide (TPR) repeat protein